MPSIDTDQASRWRFYVAAFVVWAAFVVAGAAFWHAGARHLGHQPLDMRGWWLDFEHHQLFMVILVGLIFSRSLYGALNDKRPVDRPNMAAILRQ